MGKLKESVKKYAFEITGGFEGGSFSNLAGNSDGQYLSFGIFQWNIGQNTLQPLLYRLFNEYPNICQQYMPDSGKWLKAALDEGWINGWALSLQDGNGNIINDTWKTALYNIGQTEEFQSIQMDAAQPYIDSAINICNNFNVFTDRAFCLAFDIGIQNGSLAYYDMAETEVSDKLISMAEVCAQRTNVRYQDDVRSRKMAIAKGSGYVHGKNFEFNFSDESAFEEDIITPVIMPTEPSVINEDNSEKLKMQEWLISNGYITQAHDLSSFITWMDFAYMMKNKQEKE